MLAANEAANGINVAELETNIQANLQQKLAQGASQTELLASVGSQDLSAPATDAASVTASVLAKHNIKTAAPVAAAPAAPAAPAQTTTQTAESAEEKASQEKVKELA